MEAGNDDETECHKKTSPGTLPGTRWNQEMMMEQNTKRETNPGTQPEPGHDDGTECQRVGRQTPEPYLEPGNDDGTECQKSRETNPGTLPGTRK